MLQLPPAAEAASPFAALSLIVAPAILTNACSLLIMSTSNRLARAVDLARELARQLEHTTTAEGAEGAGTSERMREMASAERRSILLLQALRAVYVALAGFAGATLLSLLSVVLTRQLSPWVLRAFESAALTAGAAGVVGMVLMAVLLMRETRIAVTMLRERVLAQQSRFRTR